MKKDAFLRRLLGLLVAVALLACLGAVALAEGGNEPEPENGIEEIEIIGQAQMDAYVVAGQPLHVTLPEVRGEATYEISFRDTDENWSAVTLYSGEIPDAEELEEPFVVDIPTDDLPAGLWAVRTIIRDGNGKRPYFRTSVVNIVEEEPEGSDVYLVLSHEDQPIYKTVKCWFYAPDAIGVSIEVCGETFFDNPGDSRGFAYIFDRPGDFDFIATAFYADGTVSEPVTEHYTATATDEEFTFEPVISDIGEDGLSIFVPRVTLEDAEQNVYYDVTVERRDREDWRVWGLKNSLETGDEAEEDILEIEADGSTITIPAAELEPGGVYDVTVTAYADGVLPVRENRKLLYRTEEPSEEVTLLVNGETQSPCDVRTHEKFFVRVEFPAGARAVRFFDGWNYRYLNLDADDEYLNLGYWPICFEDGWPNSYYMFAQAYVGDPEEEEEEFDSYEEHLAYLESLDWGAPSNEIVLNVNTDGPEVDEYDVYVPTVVTRGEPLVMNVNSYGNHAECLWCWVTAPGTNKEFYGAMVYEPQNSMAFPTAGLKPGFYSLNVNGVSYVYGSGERYTKHYFVVTEPEWDEDEVFFNVAPTDGLVAHQDFAVSAYKEGASAIVIMCRNNESDDLDDIVFDTDTDNFCGMIELDKGSYTLWVDAYVGDGNPFEDGDISHWQRSAFVDLEIASVDEGLDVELLLDSDIIQAGNPLEFTVTNLDKADDFWWDISINKVAWNEHWPTVWRKTSDEMSSTQLEDNRFVITSDELELEPGCAYEIDAWVDCRGYGGFGRSAIIYVSEGEGEGVSLTANYDGTDYPFINLDEEYIDTIDLPCGDTLYLTATAEGATAMRIFEGTHWEWVRDFEDGRADFTWRAFEGNDKFFVEAWYGEIDEEYLEELMDRDDGWQDMPEDGYWGGISNVIRVNPYYFEGELDEVCWSIQPDGDEPLTRGDTVSVELVASPDAPNCGTEFRSYFQMPRGGDRGGTYYTDDCVELPLTYELSTACLSEGEYQLVVEQRGVGYREQRQILTTVQVVEPEEPAPISFYLFNILAHEGDDADYQMYRGEKYDFSAYAPGAESFNVYFHYLDDDEEDGPWDYYDGDSMTDDRREYRDGYMETWAEAFDQNGDSIAVSDPYVILVESRGQLEAPEVSCDSVVTLEEDDDGAILPVFFWVDGLNQEHCEFWHFGVFDMNEKDDDDNWVEVFKGNARQYPAAETLEIPGECLTPGHAYRIQVWVNGEDGYDGNDSEASFYVSCDPEYDVTLTAWTDEELSTESISPLVHETVHFCVDAPGAVALLLYDGENWECRRDWCYNPDNDGHWSWTEDASFENRCYVARVAYADDEHGYGYDWEAMDSDDFDWDSFSWERDVYWAGVSNVVLVSAVGEDYADAAVVSGAPDESDMLPRGFMLDLSIESAGEEDSPSRGTIFHAYFRDAEGHRYGWGEWRANDVRSFPVNFQISTSELPVGNMWLVVDSAAPGYLWTSVEYPFTVVENDAPISFSLMGEHDEDWNYYIDDDIRFSVYAPGADSIRVFLQRDGAEPDDFDDDWHYNGDCAEGSFDRGDEDTFHIYAVAYAYNSDDDEDYEIARCDTQTFSLIRRGELQPPTIQCDMADVNMPYSFTVSGLDQEGLSWWDIRIWDEDAEDAPEVYRINPNEPGAPKPVDGVLELSVPEGFFEANHNHHINAYVSGNGYFGTEGDGYFATYAEVQDDLTLTVNGDMQTATGRTHMDSDWEFVISAEGASAVRMYQGRRWEYCRDFDDEGNAYIHGYWFEPGEYTLFAQAIYDDPEQIDWNRFDDDDDDYRRTLNWSGRSNTVQITVTSEGDACLATLDNNDGYTVTRGELLHFQIVDAGGNEPDHATEFHIHLQDRYGHWDNYNSIHLGDIEPEDLEEPLDLYLSTGAQEAGDYDLVVESCAPGYDWSQLRVPVTVIEPERGEPTEEYPEGIDPFVFEVESDELYDDVEFWMSAYEPSAQWLTVHVTPDDDNCDSWTWGPWPGCFIIGPDMRLGEGGYTLTAIAHYDDAPEEGYDPDEGYDPEDENTRESEPIHVNVNALGELQPPTIQCGTADVNMPYSFTVSGLDQQGINWWDIRIWDDDAEDQPEVYRVTRSDPEGPKPVDGVLTLDLPEGIFEANHRHHINAHINGKKFYGTGSDAYFATYADVNDALTLTVNGETEQATGLTHKDRDWEIVISAEGATAVRLFNGDGWDYRDDIEEDGNVYINGYWFDTGEYTLFAQAIYDDPEQIDWDRFGWDDDYRRTLDWSGRSNEVQITVTSEGNTCLATLDSDGYTVTRGELLRFQIVEAGGDEPGHATSFHAYIQDRGGNWDDYNSIRLSSIEPEDLEEPLDLCLCTGSLEAGDYDLVVDSCAPGYDWSQRRVPVTVIEPERGEPTEEYPEGIDPFVFEVESDELYADFDFRMSAYEPNAQWLTVHVTPDDDHCDPWTWGVWNGNFIISPDMRLNEGGYTLTAIAHYDDAPEEGYDPNEGYDPEDENTRESEPIHVNVYALEQLQAPTIQCGPADVAEPYTFTVSGLDQQGLSWWDIMIWDDDADGREVYRVSRDDPDAPQPVDGALELTVPADTFEPNHRLHIHAYVDGSRCRSNDGNAYFATYSGENEQLTLTVNGDTETATGLTHDNRDWEIVISAEGATAVRLFNGDRWDYYNYIEEDGNVYIPGYWFDTGEYTLFAQAIYDDPEQIDWDGFNWDDNYRRSLDWSGRSNEVQITVTTNGDACMATLDKGEDDRYYVTRGELLHFQIVDAGGYEPSHATNFHAFIVDNYWNWDGNNDINIGSIQPEDLEEPLDLYLCTGSLEAGDYYLVVDSCAPGYDWVQCKVPVTVIEPERGEPDEEHPEGIAPFVFDVESDELYDLVDFWMSAYEPNAQWFTVHVTPDDENDEPFTWGPWPGCFIIGRDMRLGEGGYTLVAIAHYDDAPEGEYDPDDEYDPEDENTRESDPIHVYVNALEQLQPPTIQCGPADVTQPYTFTVSGLDQQGLNWWDIRIWDDDAEGQPEVYRVTRDDPDTPLPVDGVLTLTVPADTFMYNHMHHVRVEISGNKHGGADCNAYFAACTGENEQLTLTVNGDTETATGLTHMDSDWEIVISAEGATAVRLFNGNNWDYYDNIEEDGNVYRHGYWFDTGEYTLYAQATYDDPEEIDWERFYDGNDEDYRRNLNWTGSSNAVQITVTTNGDACQATLDLNEDDRYFVTRGYLLHFQIVDAGGYDPAHATNFHAFLEHEDGWHVNGSDINLGGIEPEDLEEPLDLYFCTGNLEAGDYTLVVDSCAPGYNWVGRRVPVTVMDPSGDESFVFDIESDQLYDDVGFWMSAYEPDAQWFTVLATPDDEERDPWVFGFWPGNFIDGQNMRLSEGGYTLTAIAHYDDMPEGDDYWNDPEYQYDPETIRESAPIHVNVSLYGDMTPAEFVSWPLSPVDVTETQYFGLANLHSMGNNWYDIRVHDDNHVFSEDDEGIDDPSMVWRATPYEYEPGTDAGVDGDGVHWFNIPAYRLEPDHCYTIDVYVGMSGYNGANSQARFYTYDGIDDDIVILSVDRDEIWTGEEVTFTVQALSDATAVRIWDGYNWAYHTDMSDGLKEFTRYFDYAEDAVCFANVTYDTSIIGLDYEDIPWDDLEWSSPSNTVIVHVMLRDEEDTSTGELYVNPLNLEDGVVIGDTARVSIDCIGNVDPQSIGNLVDISIRDESNDMKCYIRYRNVSFPFEIGIPTADIEPGRYHVVVSVLGVGYEWVESWTNEHPEEEPENLWFDLYDPDENTIAFGVAKTIAMIGENIPASIYAPGAEAVRLTLLNEDDESVLDLDFDGDSWSGTFANWVPGDLTCVAYAWYPDSEDWVRSDPEQDIAMTFISSGTLDRVQQEWTTVVWEGTELQFQFTPVENAEGYNLGIVDPTAEGDGWQHQCDMQFSADDVPEGWVTVPNSAYLPGGRTYIVGVDAFAEGYDGGGSYMECGFYDSPRVSVVSRDDVLYLPAALTEIDEEAFEGVNAQMIVLPSGVTSIGYHAFANCPNLIAIVSPIEVPFDAVEGCPNDIVVTGNLPAE